MKRTSLILAAFWIIAIVSCNVTDDERPYKADPKIFADPYITGTITHIGLKQIGDDSYSEVLIEENPSVNEPLKEGGKKISLTISNETEIFTLKKDGNTYYSQKKDLKVGQIASGWLLNGIVLDSYPQQGGARQILVIEE